MRTAFAMALALSLSLAVVRANETPESLFVDAVAPVAEPSSNTPADPATSSNAAAGCRPAPEQPGQRARANLKVCVMLKADSFEIKMRKSPHPASAELTAFLICDNVTTTSAAGGATTLKCTNCELTLPGGISATASDIVFDSKSNVLTLTGSDETPVTLNMAGTESTSAKVEMKIDPQSWQSLPVMRPTNSRIPGQGDPARYGATSRY